MRRVILRKRAETGGRIAQLKQSHEDAEHGKDAEIKFPQAAPTSSGSCTISGWNALRQRQTTAQQSKGRRGCSCSRRGRNHNALAKQIDAEKSNRLILQRTLTWQRCCRLWRNRQAVGKNLRKTRSHDRIESGAENDEGACGHAAQSF